MRQQVERPTESWWVRYAVGERRSEEFAAEAAARHPSRLTATTVGPLVYALCPTDRVMAGRA